MKALQVCVIGLGLGAAVFAQQAPAAADKKPGEKRKLKPYVVPDRINWDSLIAADGKVNAERYMALTMGMDLKSVVAELGKTGVEERGRTKIGDIETVMYLWSTPDKTGTILITMQDGKLISKSQAGLK